MTSPSRGGGGSENMTLKWRGGGFAKSDVTFIKGPFFAKNKKRYLFLQITKNDLFLQIVKKGTFFCKSQKKDLFLQIAICKKRYFFFANLKKRTFFCKSQKKVLLQKNQNLGSKSDGDVGGGSKFGHFWVTSFMDSP